MESIGEKLRTARESLGYSVEQIARETNIAKRFLYALEEEDFSVFPGETYVTGFLRNYSEYLGLDPEEVLNLYRNTKIQEQPAPIEELLDNRRKIPGPVLALIIVLLLGAAGAAAYFFILPGMNSGSGLAAVTQQPREEAAAEDDTLFRFRDEVVERRFSEGDTVSVIVDNEEFHVIIEDVSDKILLGLPGGNASVSVGEEYPVDLDGDGQPDIRMILRDSSEKSGSVLMHLDRFVQAAEVDEDGPETVAASGDAAAADADEVPVSAAQAGSLGSAGVASREVAVSVIKEASVPEAFNLNVVFRGYCLMRYLADNGTREERYFHKGETLRLDASREIRVWVSNAGAFSAKISGNDINIGKPGEVSARSISWKYNSEKGLYELLLIPVY